MRIGHVDTRDRVVVIAEIGNNHEGDAGVALRLVEEAGRAGAQAVKFQTFRTEHYVGVENESRYRQLKSFELEPQEIRELADMARHLGLAFLSTPFDLESLDLVAQVGDAIKIASGDLDFIPLIRAAAETERPLLLSTGVSDVGRIQRAVDQVVAVRGAVEDVAILHCVSSYPAPPDQANLRAIPFLADEFRLTVGLSDHTLGTDASVAAVALGARIIEKHFTLPDIESDFRDHALSATPDELRELVERVDRTSDMLGTHEKRVMDAERPLADAVRRSIVAGRDMPAGHEIAWGDLTWTRPAGGLPPGDEHRLIGRRLRRPVVFGERLRLGDVE